MSLATTPTATLARSLKLRQERDPLKYFRPASPEQEQALRADGKGLLVLGGNRSGKSQIGAVRTVLKATGGELPEFPGVKFRRARRIWCVSQDLPGQAARQGELEKPHTQMEALRRWMPREALRGGSWRSAYSPSAYVLTLANGTKIEFLSYEQGPLQFESASVGHIWFDEEPTQPSIFTSCLLRLVDTRGTWDMTLTPVLSLLGKAGVAEALWECRDAGERGESPYGQYRTIQFFTSSNAHLPREEVAALELLPEEEKQVRLYGAFARLGGRVLSEFDPARHLCDDFLPPRDWRHFLIIDPGWTKTAGLWAAVDPDGNVWLYGEHYQGQWRPMQHVKCLHAMWQGFGRPAVTVQMDPANFYRKNTTTGVESPSDAQEYREAAEEIGAEWLLRLVQANNDDPMAWRVKRYLAVGRLTICRGLRWWQWEQERWTRQKEHQGAASQERPVPDAPIQRNNHLMACTRYLTNMLPDPLPITPEPEPITWEKIARERLQRTLDRQKRGRESQW